MDADRYKLVQLMADGRFYSGEKLAATFGITRAAIWKRMQRLGEELQLTIDRVPGRGYRLARPLRLLDKERIALSVKPAPGLALNALHILPSVGSTNDFVAAQLLTGRDKCIACMAEQQTAGRGRRGRSWVSAFGENIYLSLGMVFNLPLTQLSGLSIAVGVSLAEVLEQHGLSGLTLKWPNDVHVDGRKLAGILVDAAGDMEGPSRAVIGIGLNLRMDPATSSAIDQPWTDVFRETAELPDRNLLAADLLSSLLQTCCDYAAEGLVPFLARWQQFDLYQGAMVDVQQGDNVVSGRYLGLAADGGLVLETADLQKIFYAGEVSVRQQAGCN